jgi:hypothetical protein
MRELIAAWEAQRASGIKDADFYGAAILTFISVLPADLRDQVGLLWKAPMLVGLWVLVWVWYRRRSEELRDAEEGHRLLWVWGPCLSTAVALSATPVLGWVNACLMLGLALFATAVAWRRSPGPTSILISIGLALPGIAATLFGCSLLLAGGSGQGIGHHWSFADYPRWYWEGVPGRARGVSNSEAVRIGTMMLGVGLVEITLAAGIWVMLARSWLRSKRRTAARSEPVVRRRALEAT